jgi:uncharacterized protein (DUF2141 family)
MKIFLLAAVFSSAPLFAAPAEFKVENVKAITGAIYLNMFDSPQAWDSAKPTFVLKMTAILGTSTLKVDLAPGEYAFFAYHDVDNNGELKQNPFGMPTEPYAFSNNFKLQFSKPPFAKLKFTVGVGGMIHTVRLVQ